MIVSALLWVGIPLVACSTNGNDFGPVGGGQAALSPFESCEALEQHIENAMVKEMTKQLENQQSWPVFASSGEAAPAADVSTNRSQPVAPKEYTETNTQVAGVDEADFVKTNGTHIFTLSGRKLYAVKSWPAREMARLDDIDIDGFPREMFLDEQGRIVVMSSMWGHEVRSATASDAAFVCDHWGFSWGCGQQSITKVTVVDATTPSDLKILRETYLPGAYSTARRADSAVRVVIRDTLPTAEGLEYWPENYRYSPEDNELAWRQAIQPLIARNEARIRARNIDDWIRSPLVKIYGQGDVVQVKRDCSQYFASLAPVRMGLASVATLNLNDQGNGITSQVTVLGEVGEVYASKDALYIASPHWWFWSLAPGEQNITYLHKFDITDPNVARYTASGTVEGRILNQFSMDEHKKHLRAATTLSRRVVDDQTNPWGRIETNNRVTVLAQQGNTLVEVGRTADLAPGETIQSARFLGDRGFVVTFERIDPLFALDLSEPTKPTVVGELKVPGFSSYIHPLDENHLLTIGVDLPEPDSMGRVDWTKRAMKLSLFDVSDMAAPAEKFTQRVGTAHGWSEANWTHKAFNYFGARKTLAIPFSDYQPSSSDYWRHFVSDLRLFDIDVHKGITPKGSVDMQDLYITHQYRNWSWSWSPWIRRSVMADDYAYAISDAGIRVVHMDAPSNPVKTVFFNPQQFR